MNLLDAGRIRRSVDPKRRERIDSLQVLPLIDSTNSYLLQQSAPGPGRFRVVFAEHQAAGRGQRGRSWVSPQSTGLCMSLAYSFASRPANIASLTLAIGIAIATMAEEMGVVGIGLKWPNDLICNDAKLGGILTETRGASGVTVVTGIGINVDLAASIDRLEQVVGPGQVTDLCSCLGYAPSRNLLGSRMINSLCGTVDTFESDGFAAFKERWPSYDWLRGRRVCVDVPDGQLEGVADGIDERGALCLLTSQGRKAIVSGSVRISQEIGSVA